jgi:hypothetical protein
MNWPEARGAFGLLALLALGAPCDLYDEIASRKNFFSLFYGHSHAKTAESPCLRLSY